MTRPVGIVGANGFLGGELVRLLSMHPNVHIAAMGAGRTAGKQLSSVRPSLRGPADGPLEAFDADAFAERCDTVFLALPHGASAKVARELRAREVDVIDLGSDFRLEDPADHVTYYGREAEAPELLGEAVYSLPELTGAPEGAGLIANPGCFATALALTTTPLAPHLAEGAGFTVFGVTGSSGSGIDPKSGTQHTLRVNSFKAYKTLHHQHLGEVRQLLGSRGRVPPIRFVPHSLPAPRGIHLTTVISRDALDGSALEILADAYAGAALVDVVPGEIAMGATLLSCRVLIGVIEDGDDIVVFTAIDNLLKGGSGQAVQNLNLAQGWSETLGLPVVGAWP